MVLRANVIHLDLNPCGGAEQLALATLQSLIEMGMQIDLTVAKMPNIGRIEKAFGSKIRSIFSHIKVKPLGKLPIELDRQTGTLVCRRGSESNMMDYDVIVNTHGDILPYFLPHFSAKKCITYCHFPVVAGYVREKNSGYVQALIELDLFDKDIAQAIKDDCAMFWRSLLEYYLLMIRNSLVVTNSRFSCQAIIDAMKSSTYPNVSEPTIIPPPVSVEEFSLRLDGRNNNNSNNLSEDDDNNNNNDNNHNGHPLISQRLDHVLVVSRIHPSKKLENAIELARVLQHRGIGRKMIIAGNLSSDDVIGHRYYGELTDLIDRYRLSNYAVINLNVELARLRMLMRRSKAYFHPMPEEPFGISVVEAMAAGLIPVVPDVGGPTEFVPRQYQFSTIEEAAEIVQNALQVPNKQRLLISDSVRNFSKLAYIKHFQRFVSEELATVPQYERGAAPRQAAATSSNRRALSTNI